MVHPENCRKIGSQSQHYISYLLSVVFLFHAPSVMSFVCVFEKGDFDKIIADKIMGGRQAFSIRLLKIILLFMILPLPSVLAA